MKIRIIVFVLLWVAISCKAQHIIPVENGHLYIGTEKGFMGDFSYVYVKDINNVLSKFVGVWVGTYQTNIFEFRITKITKDDGELKEDLLLLRYRITDAAGIVLEDTLLEEQNSPYVMKNGYVSYTGSYVFNYIGKDFACGQNGWVFAGVYGSNEDQMKLFLQLKGEIYPECVSGEAIQLLPLSQIELQKQ